MRKCKKFSIAGNPVAKERPRKGKYGNFYTPAKTRKFENFIKLVALQHFDKPLDCPIKIHIKFKIKRPKYLIWKTKPMPEVPCTTKDLDNMIKSVLDGMEGVAYHNDSQIYSIIAEKVYHAGGDKAETIIEIFWDDDGY